MYLEKWNILKFKIEGSNLRFWRHAPPLAPPPEGVARCHDLYWSGTDMIWSRLEEGWGKLQTASNPWWSIYRCNAQVSKGSPGIRARRFHLAMPKKSNGEEKDLVRVEPWKRKNRRKTEIGSLGIGRVVLIGRWQKNWAAEERNWRRRGKNMARRKTFWRGRELAAAVR